MAKRKSNKKKHKKEEEDNRPKLSANSWIVLVLLFIIALSAVNIFGDSLKDNPEPVKGASNINGTKLEVKPSGTGGPAPLDFNLQGSEPDSQSTSKDSLQPQQNNVQNSQKFDSIKDLDNVIIE